MAGQSLARIGDGSYSLYLSHWFVLSFIGKFAALVPGAPVPFVVIWHVTAIASAVAFAVLFAEYIELPFHRRLLNHLKSLRGVVRNAIGEDKTRATRTLCWCRHLPDARLFSDISTHHLLSLDQLGEIVASNSPIQTN